LINSFLHLQIVRECLIIFLKGFNNLNFTFLKYRVGFARNNIESSKISSQTGKFKDFSFVFKRNTIENEANTNNSNDFPMRTLQTEADSNKEAVLEMHSTVESGFLDGKKFEFLNQIGSNTNFGNVFKPSDFFKN